MLDDIIRQYNGFAAAFGAVQQLRPAFVNGFKLGGEGEYGVCIGQMRFLSVVQRRETVPFVLYLLRQRQAAAQAGFDGQAAVLKHGKQLAARFQQEGQLVFGQLARFAGCVGFALDEG